MIKRLRADEVDDALWRHARDVLAGDPRIDRKLIDLAAALGLRWPATRANETPAILLKRELHELVGQHRVGVKRRRALFLSVAALLDPGQTAALEQEAAVERGKLEAADAALSALWEGRDEPNLEGRIDRFARDLLEYVVGLRPLHGAKDRWLLARRFGIDVTLSDHYHVLADEAGLTRERVRQIIDSYGEIAAARNPTWRSALEELHAYCSKAPARNRIQVLARFLGKGVSRRAPISLAQGIRRWAFGGPGARRSPVLLDQAQRLIAADLGREISLESLRAVAASEGLLASSRGREYLYSYRPRDRVHRTLALAAEPLSLHQLARRSGRDVRELRRALEKDARIVLIEGDRLTVLTSPDGLLDDGRIALPLQPLQGGGAATITLDTLARFTSVAMRALGVPTVTTAGFRRLANLLLESLVAARIDERFPTEVLHRAIGVELPQVHLIRGDRIGLKETGREPSGIAWTCRAIEALGGPCTEEDVVEWLEARYQDTTPALYRGWLERGRKRGGYSLREIGKRVAIVPKGSLGRMTERFKAALA